MTSTPCEAAVWQISPAIRKEFAKCLVNNYRLSQKQTAEKLGITPAAVCQYVKDKRGNNQEFDKKIIEEIKISAKKIIETDKETVPSETCRICHIIRITINQKRLILER